MTTEENPRLAFYYESSNRIHRNDGPPLYWFNQSRELFGKDNVIHLIPNGDTKNFGRYDYHFWVDWGEDALMPMLPYIPETPPSPNVYITSDTHLGYPYRLATARKFDWVFCNQMRAVEDFVKDGIPKERCMWLPHAAEPKAYPKKTVINKYDVCFVGNIGDWNRVEFLDRMFKEFPNFFYGKRLFEECAEVYNQSKIVLNCAIKDDINMRVFETLASGSFLLTSHLDTQDILFQDGVHLATYKTIDEAVDKAKYYMDHDSEREKIAQAGYEEVMKKHTYEQRLKTVLAIIKKDESAQVVQAASK